jgi:DNA-directed RNA polymerase beta subunit
MKNLLEAGILQQSKTINPLEELMLSQKIIKTGIGNVKKSQVTLARRDLNKSYFGVISPTATNEYGGIGANQTLTNGTTILDRFGSIQTKKYNNNNNPFNMLSPVESCIF